MSFPKSPDPVTGPTLLIAPDGVTTTPCDTWTFDRGSLTKSRSGVFSAQMIWRPGYTIAGGPYAGDTVAHPDNALRCIQTLPNLYDAAEEAR